MIYMYLKVQYIFCFCSVNITNKLTKDIRNNLQSNDRITTEPHVKKGDFFAHHYIKLITKYQSLIKAKISLTCGFYFYNRPKGKSKMNQITAVFFANFYEKN